MPENTQNKKTIRNENRIATTENLQLKIIRNKKRIATTDNLQ